MLLGETVNLTHLRAAARTTTAKMPSKSDERGERGGLETTKNLAAVVETVLAAAALEPQEAKLCGRVKCASASPLVSPKAKD